MKYTIMTGTGKQYRNLDHGAAVDLLKTMRHDKLCNVMVKDDHGDVPANFLELAADIEREAGYVGASPRECEHNLKRATRGRPRMGDDRRVRLCTSVDPATAAAIDADRRDNESQGQVLDRWARLVQSVHDARKAVVTAL